MNHEAFVDRLLVALTVIVFLLLVAWASWILVS